MNNSSLLVLSIAVFFISCSSGLTKAKNDQFFGIKEYFENEIITLKENAFLISKKSTYNTKSDSIKQKSKDVNWENEWALFLELDINKPSYYNAMDYSKTRHEERYTNTKKSMPIQSVVLALENNVLKKVSIEIKTSNFISNEKINLEYIPLSSYKIEGRKKTMFSDEENYLIEAQITYELTDSLYLN